MPRLWRIAADTPTYTSDSLSGEGARITGARWNRPGHPTIYCANTPALACLETLVHIETAGLPLNRYLVAIDIPDALWKAAESHGSQVLPVGWDAIPHSMVSLDFGDAWLKSKRSVVLVLPSVISEEDFIAVINPRHKDAKRIKATKLRKWLYDPRLV